jgi:hypothetical protein
MFVTMSIQHRFVNKITIQYGVAPEHLVVGTLEVGLDGVDLVNEILHSDNALPTKVVLDDLVVSEWGCAGRGPC